eukprot:9523533-Lingulodinium_polyedra.AAC.1
MAVIWDGCRRACADVELSAQLPAAFAPCRGEQIMGQELLAVVFGLRAFMPRLVGRACTI